MADLNDVRTTKNASGSGVEDRLVRDVKDVIYTVAGQWASLVALTGGAEIGEDGQFVGQVDGKIDKVEAHNPEFQWYDRELTGNNSAATANTTATEETIVFTATANFRVGDLLYNRTQGNATGSGELVLVKSITDATTLEAARNLGGTSFTITAADEFVVVGNANKEHSSKRAFKSALANKRSNYLEIFNWGFGVSRTERESDLYGVGRGKDMQDEEEKALVEFSRQVEFSFWYGRKAETQDADGAYRRSTGGALSYISTQTYDVNQTLTEAKLMEEFAEKAFQFGSEEKWLFGAGYAAKGINRWAKSHLQIDDVNQKKYGIRINLLETPFGLWHWVPSGALRDNTPGLLVSLDLKNVHYRFLRNSDVFLMENIQDNSVDGEEAQYVAEVGLMLEAEKTHAFAYDISAVGA